MILGRRQLFGLTALAAAVAAASCGDVDNAGDAGETGARAGTDEVAEIVGPVPPISSFPTVNEMNAFIDRIAGGHPDRVRVAEIGRSRAGQPIRDVVIGSGSRHILVLGNPHANEPIGLATTRHLLSRFAEDDSLTSALGVTWHFVPLIDPDATRLGDGWYGGPFTRSNVARHFYRQTAAESTEWTFPMTWRGNRIGTPLPETRALTSLIDATRPALVASLHNADYGGGFCYVSGGDAEYWSGLAGLLTGNRVPLHRGEPDAAGARLLTEGVFRMPSFEELCDAIAVVGGDPLTQSGGSSGHYAAAQYGSAHQVCELPLWTDPRLTDDTPADMSMAELTRASAALTQEIADIATDVLARVGDRLSGRSPLQVMVEGFIPAAREMTAAKNARRVPDRRATWSEVTTDLYGWPAMMRLRIGGPLDRLLREEAASSGSPELHAETVRFGATFDRWCAEIERDAPGQLVPPNQLVAIQAATIITAVTRLRDRRPV